MRSNRKPSVRCPSTRSSRTSFGHAAEAICSAEIDFTGAPGTLLGRYFGESSSLTYGLYSKLEAGLGHAYNELYWNVEGDRTPLLTVTNFSDTTERIDIWATRDAGSKILRTVELPAKANVHINMQQDFTQRAAELQYLRDQAYGGFFIRAENPTARILVKVHIFSQSRQVASPYYGSVDILISHHIQSYPPQMVAGQNATVHENLDGRVSIRYGLHVIAQYAQGQPPPQAPRK